MLTGLKSWHEFAAACKRSRAGKRLSDAFYVHLSALTVLDPLLQAYERRSRRIATTAAPLEGATLVKFYTDRLQVSYLFYPDFDIEPHPALAGSLIVDLESECARYQDYSQSQNPPILHRKETFVTTDYPHYQAFAALTHQEDAIGLLKNPSAIGTRQKWAQRLAERQVELQGHRLISHAAASPAGQQQPASPIERHKAAISRNELSKPVRLSLEAGLFGTGTTFFDYGCGLEGDVRRVAQLGYESAGWDPYYRPEAAQVTVDIVNLGFVINVIESPTERRKALQRAWALTREVLIVAAQVVVAQGEDQIAYGDGVVTSRNTFQKYYDQQELKHYIDSTLGVDAVPVALGIYFVFRDEGRAQSFRASRFRSRVTTPRLQVSHKRFEDYQAQLQPLIDFVTERGRLPFKKELPQEGDLKTEFGSLRRAFQVILQATDRQAWDEIAEKRRQDFLVYLALSNFDRRPKLREFPSTIENDIKALFGTYKQARTSADAMLLSVGNLDAIAARACTSEIGKQTPKALWVHVSALERLDPLLRLYEGCASRTVGRPEEATVVKLHTRKPKVSYLSVPEFDTVPHPIIRSGMQVELQELKIHYWECDPTVNPPLVHQKDHFVASDYPHYNKFARLSRQEASWGLLDDLSQIARLRGWTRCLERHCATLKGHRVVWRQDADPYRIKLVRSQRRHQRAQDD